MASTRPRKRLPRLSSVATLTALALEGADGRDWYQDAESCIRSVCEPDGWDPATFADVLALTSPRVQVKRNWLFAIHYMETGACHPIMMATIRGSVEHWERSGEIRGPKTGPFARACLGDPDAVVLDVWMAVAFGVDQSAFSNRPPVHRECVRRVRAAARRLGWEARQVQAAVWYAVVRRANRKPVSFSDVMASAQGVAA